MARAHCGGCAQRGHHRRVVAWVWLQTQVGVGEARYRPRTQGVTLDGRRRWVQLTAAAAAPPAAGTKKETILAVLALAGTTRPASNPCERWVLWPGAMVWTRRRQQSASAIRPNPSRSRAAPVITS